MTNEEIWLALSDASWRINGLMDKLKDSIATIDHYLSQLNIGIPMWRFLEPGDEERERIGYAKLHGRWGLCLGARDSEWRFNDAPRVLRLKSVDSIADLFLLLQEAADETSRQIEEKIAALGDLSK